MSAQGKAQADRVGVAVQARKRGGGEPTVGAVTQERLVELVEQSGGVIVMQ